MGVCAKDLYEFSMPGNVPRNAQTIEYQIHNSHWLSMTKGGLENDNLEKIFCVIHSCPKVFDINIEGIELF